jgi:ABC-2 type transport system ATP-binding protein
VIDYAAGLAGVPRAVRRRRSAELLALVGMAGARRRLVGTYSKGMVQRIGLAQALVNDPELVLLDEPTDGVDPAGRRDMRNLLVRLRDEGRTVFINSHLLGELEMVCDAVAILKEGQVVCQGRLDDLTAATRRFEVLVENESPPDLAADFRHDRLAVDGRRIEVPGRDPAPVQPVIDALRSRGLVIAAVRPRKQSLEDLFLESVRDDQP